MFISLVMVIIISFMSGYALKTILDGNTRRDIVEKLFRVANTQFSCKDYAKSFGMLDGIRSSKGTI